MTLSWKPNGNGKPRKTKLELNRPNNKQAEELVVGMIVLDPTLLAKSSLTPEDFYHPRLRLYYKTFQDICAAEIPLDLTSIGNNLSEEELSLVTDLMGQAVTTANFGYYENQVKELSIKRKIQNLCLYGASKVVELSVDEAVAELRNGLADAIRGRGVDLVGMKEIAHEIYTYVERRASRKGEISGVTSGLKDVDQFTDGFQNGDLVIIAGRPGSGKSAVAMHIAHSAADKNIPVGFISLEMGTHQLGIRSMASLSKLPMWMLRKGILGDSAWPKMVAGAGLMSSLPIWFTFTARDAGSITKAITSMVEQKQCKIIFLDYLQLARGNDQRSREREVAQVSLTLKTAAQLNKIPVIALAQLNRNPERENRKPMLADLRESGALEQDADVVMFLHRSKEEENVVEIIFAKGRNIGTGEVKSVFDSNTMTFKDYSPIEGDKDYANKG